MIKNPSVAGILPGKGFQSVPEKKLKVPKNNLTMDAKEQTKRLKSKPKPATTPRPLPTLKWSKMPINLTLSQAEARIQIREFVLRFAPILDIARGHAEELDNIGGNGRGWNDEDDEEGMTSWVSKGCVKSVILGLLALFAGEADSAAKVCCPHFNVSFTHLDWWRVFCYRLSRALSRKSAHVEPT